MTTGKEINETIKTFLRGFGATSETSGLSPEAIGQAVKNLLGTSKEENVDIGLAVFNLLRKYRDMKTTGPAGSVLANAGKFWLNPNGGVDATTAFPIGLPTTTGFAAASSRSTAGGGERTKRMGDTSKGERRATPPIDPDEANFDASPESLETITGIRATSDCCKLLASVIALNEAGILDDYAFKRAVVNIAAACGE